MTIECCSCPTCGETDRAKLKVWTKRYPGKLTKAKPTRPTGEYVRRCETCGFDRSAPKVIDKDTPLVPRLVTDVTMTPTDEPTAPEGSGA